MYRMNDLIPIALLGLGLSGCGSPRPVKYYTVQIPVAPASSTGAYPIELLVGRVTGPALLQAEPIVYRTGTNELSTYLYHRWADPPVEMVQAKLIRLLRSSGHYQSVSRVGSQSNAEFMVRARLYEFTEVDGESINGLVTIEFELYNRKTAKILWTHSYSQVEPVQSKEVSAVVSALDRNLDRGLKEVVTGLGQYFAANPPNKTS